MIDIELKKKIRNLPKRPGIYMFSTKNGKILYIGKASNLKNRINSYLKTDDPRIKKMLELAKSLEHTVTNSDIEALILESQLIKKNRPQFNIMLRDDKQYFYVGFTSDIFPKIFLTHQPQEVSGIKYKVPSIKKGSEILNTKYIIHNTSHIGPFTDGSALKTTLRFLRSVFPYCTCKQLHHNYCLNYHIGKCPGFCCLKNHLWITDFASRLSTGLLNPTTYKKNIASIKLVLSGKKKSVIRNLEKEMVQSAKRGELEKAIELKSKLEKLKRVFQNSKIIHNTKYLIHDTKIIIKSQSVSKELTRLLKLEHVPHRIEGYDISNIQGAHATGSMVTFINGQPNKNFYRKFKINSKQTPDDTAMLQEILERRFRHDEWPFPDLILIDGGKGQVSAARAAITNYHTNYQGSTLNLQKGRALKTQKIPVIGISKNERHLGHQLIIPGRKSTNWRTISLTKLTPADKNLLLTINSEAHRFAIGYYRKLHRKKALWPL